MAANKPKWTWERTTALASGLVTLAFAPWGVFVIAVLGIAASVWVAAFSFMASPRVQIAIQVYLVLLATYVAIGFLRSLKAVATVRTLPDVKYAINPEGYTVAFDEDKPDAAFQLGVGFRNLLNWPIKAKVETFRLVVGDRVCPDLPDDFRELIIPRVGARGVKSGLFSKDVVKDRFEGNLELAILYGDADGDFTRRYYQKLKLHFAFIKDDNGKYTQVQVQDEIVTMEDKPYTSIA
jgi:hypothetical protein